MDHEHPNATAYRKAADAFRAADLAALEALVDWAPDAPGSTPRRVL